MLKTDKTHSKHSVKHAHKKTGRAARRLPNKAVILAILLVVFATLLFALLNYRGQESKPDMQGSQAAQSTATAPIDRGDRGDYGRLEKDMADIYVPIVKATGDMKFGDDRRSYCSRATERDLQREKYELYCHVVYNFSPQETGIAETRTIANAVVKAIESEKFRSVSTDSRAEFVSELTQDNLTRTFSKQYAYTDTIRCELTLDTKPGKTDQEVESLYLFDCGGGSEQAVYPVQERK